MRPMRCPWPLFGLLLALLAPAAAAAPPEEAPGPGRVLAPPPPWLPHYDLDIRLDLKGHDAHVRQRVTWTNCSAEAVHEIVFNAHSRYVVPKTDRLLLAKTLEILRMNPDEGLYAAKAPFDLHHAAAGGQESRFHYAGDTQTDLVVPLPAPLPPGQAVTVELDYTLHLPQTQGRWGQWQGVTFLSNWIPVVAVHDQQGWQPTPFVPWHQPFFNEAGVYTVRVTLPADQKVACSGTITGRHELPGGLQQVDITAEGVRDFALLSSARYVEYTAEAATLPGLPPVRLHMLAFPEHEHYARFMLKTIAEVIPYYSRLIGPYPWPDFTVAESFFGWNGNECATLVMIDERVFGMPHIGEGYVEYLICHETCHQWWYNLIGTNGWCETWMDEAMATYFAHKFLDQKYGHNNKMLRYPHGLEWLPNIPSETYRYYTMYGVIGRGENGPIVQEMPKFKHVVNLFGMCYDKGSKVVGMIEDRLGPDGFCAFIHLLHDHYRYRIIRVADVKRELQEFTGQREMWEEFFQRWLYGAGLCDWCVEDVRLEPVGGHADVLPARVEDFLAALRRGKAPQPYKVTVLLRQKGDYDEPTVLGFCLDACGKKDDERLPYQVRIPILPQAQVVEHPELSARVETLPDHRVRVEIELPCRPVQIAVDPDQVLVDREPANNYWHTPVRWRFSPVFTLLDESDMTTAYDCWNVTFGPWLNGAAYADAWYQRATVVGARLAAYRTAQFDGGVYAGYRTTYQDFVVGADGLWDHLPWDHTQFGFNVEQRVGTLTEASAQPNREVLFGRYVFEYGSSLYLPPIWFAEAYVTRQDNFLPLPNGPVPVGAERFDHEDLVGLHHHLDLRTPYWDPQSGITLDLTYAAGDAKLARDVFTNQLIGQFSFVRTLPDVSGHLDEETWPGKVAEPVLRWLADTRLAGRVYGAGGWPNQGQYFALGGDTMFRGLPLSERQGSSVWLASLEWRVPILRHTHYDAVDHILELNNVYAAVFYDVGDAYTSGHSEGPVAHGVGAGLRFDVTWFGFVERTALRFDVARAVNIDGPVQFLFGANMPF